MIVLQGRATKRKPSGIIASIAMVPISTCVKLGSVPVALQTKHTIDFAG